MTMVLTPAKLVVREVAPKTMTPEKLAAQAGFYGLRTWTFSWDKNEGLFHLREGDLNLYVVGIEGYTEIVKSDGKTGRITLCHAMRLDGEGNATWDNSVAQLAVSADAPEQQMCFARSEGKWRIWPREDPKQKQTVLGYQGPAYVFKPRADRGHIFARTPFEVIDGLVVFG